MIKRLARCIREYKWAAILSPLTMIGEVSMEVTIPLIMAQLYDYGIVRQDMDTVISKSILLVLCAIASLCFGCASAVFAAKAGSGFAKNLRHDMYHHIQSYSFSNIDKFSTASIVTRLTSDVARALELSHPTVSGLLARMERKGFLQLRQDPRDKRARRIHLLPRGMECAAHIEEVIRANEQRMVQDFTEEERQRFMEYLDRAIVNMGGSPCPPHHPKEE